MVVVVVEPKPPISVLFPVNEVTAAFVEKPPNAGAGTVLWAVVVATAAADALNVRPIAGVLSEIHEMELELGIFCYAIKILNIKFERWK